MRSKIPVSLVFSVLLIFLFSSCTVEDDDGDIIDGCKANSDCPWGTECNVATGKCDPKGDTGDTGNTGDSGNSGDSGNTGNGVDCNGHGVIKNEQCQCYDNYKGELCDQCEDGYSGYPECFQKMCEPGTLICTGMTVQECNNDGSDYVDVKTCEGEGIICYKGDCRDECGIAFADHSYVGCEYWGVFLQQYEKPSGIPNYALVVANPNDTVITATVYTKGNVKKMEKTIPPGSIEPFILGTEGRITGAGITDTSFKLVSSRPVTVTQMNPFGDQMSGGSPLIRTNDATILLPVGAMEYNYYVVSWPHNNFSDNSSYSGFASIVAVEEGTTTVTVKYNASTKSGNGVNAQLKGDKVTYSLNRYDILTINTKEDGCPLNTDCYGHDLTGSFITSDKRIAVFGGHGCAQIPAEKCCCDHLEHQIFPLETWGKNYVASRTKPRGGELDHFRIVSSLDGTVVNWKGGVSGSVNLSGGQHHDFATDSDFVVESNNPVIVAQYLASEGANAGTGDPAMMLLAPSEQFRKDYIFLVPPNYSFNTITVIAAKDTEIKVNETSYSSNSFTQIPGTEWLKHWIDVPTGAHTLKSDKPVGLYVYGFSSFVSYAYTAGLDLQKINDQY